LATAAAFYYADAINIQWQLLIIVTFLFFGTLALFTVLFDDTINEVSTSVTTHENFS
jgi:hypothetical protein